MVRNSSDRVFGSSLVYQPVCPRTARLYDIRHARLVTTTKDLGSGGQVLHRRTEASLISKARLKLKNKYIYRKQIV